MTQLSQCMLTSVWPEWRWRKRSWTKNLTGNSTAVSVQQMRGETGWSSPHAPVGITPPVLGYPSPFAINTEIILPNNGCAHPATIGDLHTKATIALILCRIIRGYCRTGPQCLPIPRISASSFHAAIVCVGGLGGPEPWDHASGLPGLMTLCCPQFTWSCCCSSFNCSACGYGTLTCSLDVLPCPGPAVFVSLSLSNAPADSNSECLAIKAN